MNTADDRITALIDPEFNWLNVATYVGVMLMFGVVIGIISRGHVRLAGPLSIIVGTLSYAFMLWRDASPDEWSWSLPIAMFHITSAAICSVGPVFLGAGIVRWFVSRRAKHLTMRSSEPPTGAKISK